MNLKNLNWSKVNGLLPVIIQDSETLQVLMLGFMNQEALEKTLSTKLITFYSRSKQRLWTKGETSRNYLQLVEIIPDCDNDTLLMLAQPQGPCCHLNTSSCFGKQAATGVGFLTSLERLISQRFNERPKGSYTTDLFNSGVKRIAQKIGEEGVEVALAGVMEDRVNLKAEIADLLYHLLVLLKANGMKFSQVIDELKIRQC